MKVIAIILSIALFITIITSNAVAVASVIGWDIEWQLLSFAIGTALAFITVRPLVYKFFYKKKDEVKTNAEALIGRKAIVSERIEGELNPGRVKVDGDDWKAISLESEPIEVGDAVEITAINSIILTVKKL